MRNIVRDGYREILTTQITLEMKLIDSRQMMDRREPYKFKPEKWESLAWVGRHLRTYGFVETNAPAARNLHFGASLRIYPVKDSFLNGIIAKN